MILSSKDGHQIKVEDCDWYCDNCGAFLNTQSGFNYLCGTWVCTECGYCNEISEDNIFDENSYFYDDEVETWDRSKDD